ncbi:hypothetical protein DUI87_05032 [Hirundo rustica rustica]|uniref:Integrase catalytic domain-containing protein n=1 Tax=Hirundo rustica rustica TaxID=333673 RepID=A0A3M0KZN4_HIRRU|nr:hypothetical protein DUI87_05032 [Hirundo rustica rustica]
MWASADTGEKARDVIAHWRQAFAVLGIPSAVKTDNGPAYASQQSWDDAHQPRAKVRVRNLVTSNGKGPMTLSLWGVGMRVCPRTLGHTGYLQSVSILTCDHRGRIWPTGKVEAMINLKVSSRDHNTGLNSEDFVIGDAAHTPMKIGIAPMTIKGNTPKLILLACCPQPPFYLAKGQIIAQAIPTPAGVLVDEKTHDVYWAEVVGEDKPIMGCNLTCGNRPSPHGSFT